LTRTSPCEVDLANLSIHHLGIYASPDAALKLAALRSAKGREYQAVAMIDLYEGRIPFYQARTAEDLEEAKRLFYVGVTRAKRFLFYVTDNSDRRNGPRAFCARGPASACVSDQ
jgi:ATP-dependent DNA helicase UvrD/PcrA